MEATVFIKNPKDEKVQETMKMWFDMLLKFGKRDQLLFPYCAYKTGLKIKWINEKVFENNWFDWSNHIQKNTQKNMEYTMEMYTIIIWKMIFIISIE